MPNSSTIRISSIYHDDNIISLNDYKERKLGETEAYKSIAEMLGMEEMQSLDILIFMLETFHIEGVKGLYNERELMYIIENMKQNGRMDFINTYIKHKNLSITREEFIYDYMIRYDGNYMEKYRNFNDVLDAILEMEGIDKEQVEEEYKQYLQNFETNKNIPNDVENKVYKFTYPDGTKEEIQGVNLAKFEKYYEVTENGIQVINIEESGQNQEIKVDVDKIIKTVKKNEYVYIPYSNGYKIKTIDKTLQTYTKPEMVINGIKVNDMSYMFESCTELTSANLSILDTSNVINMEGMFADCTKLTSLDLSGLNTSNVTNMKGMFYKCNALIDITVNELDTSKVTDMGGMFANCTKLTNLNLNGLNTSNVINMKAMFYYCTGLTDLDVEGVDTSRVMNMGRMFMGCESLTELNLDFNTNNVKSMESMFRDCSKLSNILVSKNWMIKEGIEILDMYKNCATSQVTYK